MATWSETKENPIQPTIDYAARYDTPGDVLADLTLNLEGKRSILRRWRFDAERLSESAAEGLQGGERPPLREVNCALALLEDILAGG